MSKNICGNCNQPPAFDHDRGRGASLSDAASKNMGSDSIFSRIPNSEFRRTTLPKDPHPDVGQVTPNPNTRAALLRRLSKQLNATSPGAADRISQAAANCTLS